MAHARHLWQRAAFFQSIRTFFIDREYLEVDTPIRIPAPAPEAFIEPEPAGDWFLQTSPELCMKRLLAADFPKIFQICKCFRRQERGDRHLPEFTMLEWYRRDADYGDLMADCEQLLPFVANAMGLGPEIVVGGGKVSLAAPWQRLTVAEAFSRFGTMSLEDALAEDSFDEVLVRDIEPHLGIATPTFLYDYPAVLGSLARLNPENPKVAERFELYVGGMELANGFSELDDAVEQRSRFEKERQLITELGRQPAGPMPESFLAALSNMGPAAGIALGLDRFLMLLLGVQTIDEVVPFTPESL
ncbi:MAG: EF-P lysine aminoacylase EpmA [Desulfobulbaceae bacterium]|nr:EF-P lysine aminoacylase EpmA [Desulfobulbaceae bacterium]